MSVVKWVRSAPERNMPVVYKEAISALQKCTRLEDVHRFSDAAEALAVWSKIYRDNQAGKEARQLRLHAHRRMGELAIELAPVKGKKGGGRTGGPVAELKRHGLSRHNADAAHHLGKMNNQEFSALIDQDVPPAPTSVVRRIRTPTHLSFLQQLRNRPKTPFACLTFINKNDPDELVKMLTMKERKTAAEDADALIAWLHKFKQSAARRT